MIGCRPLTDQEVELVLGALDNPRDRCLFILGIRTGFRISELLSLRISDVTEYGSVASQVTVRRGCMKGKHQSRTVPLHPQAKEALTHYIESLGARMIPQSRLFPFTRQHAWRIFKGAVVNCKLTGKLGTHAMRKTFASRVFTALGENIFKTQMALGHASPASTVNYLSFKNEEIDKAILGVG